LLELQGHIAIIGIMVRKTKHSHVKNLPVQSLSAKHIFSSQDLVWSDIEHEDDTIDRTALIPYNRLEDFIMERKKPEFTMYICMKIT
jgi:hypothetical protein